MPASLVEQYERILAADPRSLVFVELARSLLERGDAARAAEVCRKGLSHHPESIQGRVTLGRALLRAGDVPGGLVELRAAAAVEPDNPYGWNLATEAAAEAGLEARQLLAATPPAAPPGTGGLATEGDPGAAPVPDPAADPSTGGGALAGPSGPELEEGPPAAPGAPPPIPRRGPPPVPRPRAAPGLLGELPTPEAPAPPEATAPPPANDLDEIATTYERELRAEVQARPAPPEPRKRYVLLIAGVVAAVLAVAGGVGTYLASRRAHRAEDARVLLEAARRGVLRDTAGSLREAERALLEARNLDPASVPVGALLSLTAALRAADHEDRGSRGLAERLSSAGSAGDAAPLVAFLLAPASSRAEAARAAAGAPPLPGATGEAVAAEAMLVSGDATAATARLEAAARSTPPSLRALTLLGDRALARGEPEEALAWLAAALAAHPTHPGAALRAAEARLALRRDLPDALASLKAVEADPGSAPAAADRPRFELAMSRLLVADGQRRAAEDRLEAATARPGAPADLFLTLAGLRLGTGNCTGAGEAARRAREIADSPAARVLEARAWLCLGQTRPLLAATEGQDSTEMRLVRADALLVTGDARAALAEVEPLGRGGRMPAEAAARYALALDQLGRRAQARAVADRLVALPDPPAEALVAAAAFAAADGSRDLAERRYRAALEHDPDLAEAHCGLGRLLLAQGRTIEAVNELARAVALAPAHEEASRALARARDPSAPPSPSPPPQRRQRPASTKLK
jgi:cellulose synthase operon protein C